MKKSQSSTPSKQDFILHATSAGHGQLPETALKQQPLHKLQMKGTDLTSIKVEKGSWIDQLLTRDEA